MNLEDLVQRALADQAREMAAVPDVTALVARGVRARRRRLAIVASFVATVVIGVAAATPLLRNTAVPAPVTQLPSPTLSSYPTATVGPGRALSYFLGSRPDVDVTFTMPAGWEVTGVWVTRSGNGPQAALAFVDVANVYTDGCRWRRVDPQPGPSVDDLVTAYAKVPGSEPAKDISVDGYSGKQIQVSIPDYQQVDCEQDKFGVMQHDNDANRGDEPTLGASAPGGRYTVQILDVDGTRLVIFVEYPPDVSEQDRIDLDGILRSIDIG